MQRANYDPEAERQRLIRLIHVAKRDLNLQDDDYRAILISASGGKDSSADMNIMELEKVVSHLKKCGFKVRTNGKKRPAKAKSSRPLASDPESQKIRALWLLLHDLGAVKNPSEAALAAYVKRMAGVDALQWVKGDKFEVLIESLKKWAMRFLPDAVKALAERAKAIRLTPDEAASLNYGLNLAFSRGTFDPMVSVYQQLAELVAMERV